jgi:hypothetical protein
MRLAKDHYFANLMLTAYYVSVSIVYLKKIIYKSSFMCNNITSETSRQMERNSRRMF